MSITKAEAKAVLLKLSREELAELQRLPPKEAIVIIELHHHFPGTRRVEEDVTATEPYDPSTVAIPY